MPSDACVILWGDGPGDLDQPRDLHGLRQLLVLGRGGEGFGLPEVAVVLEELGRVVAPGPFLPTVLASAAIAAGGQDEVGAALLPGLCDGSTTGAVALSPPTITAQPAGGEAVCLSGRVRPVLGAAQAGLFVLPSRGPDGERWYAVDAGAVTVGPLP